MFHSERWCGSDRLLQVTFRDGRTFRTSPKNVGVQTHHNRVRAIEGNHDALEQYFANEIDTHAAPALTRFLEGPRERVLSEAPDFPYLQQEKHSIRADGFRIPKALEFQRLDPPDKLALARYVASMIVRVPSYKDATNGPSLVEYMTATFGLSLGEAWDKLDIHHFGLVIDHIEQYANKLAAWQWIAVEADGTQEFLFGDTPALPVELSGAEVDLYFPLTPKLALVITRHWRSKYQYGAQLFRASNKLIGYYNRCEIMNAERIVVSERTLPDHFVKKNFGQRQLRIKADIDIVDTPSIELAPLLR